MNRFFTLSFSVFLAATPAFADGHGEHKSGEMKRPWSLSLGATTAYLPEYKGSNDYETVVFPLIRAKYRFDKRNSLFFNGFEGLGYKYRAGNGFAFGVSGSYRRGRDSSDDIFLFNMPDVEDAFEVGPFVSYKTPVGVKLSASYRVGLDNNNAGGVTEFSARYGRSLNEKLRLGVGVSTRIGDGEYMDDYYTVKPAQALGNRTVFNASQGFEDVSLSGNLNYKLDDHQFVSVLGGYNFLVGDARESSLSQSDGSGIVGIGWGYKF